MHAYPAVRTRTPSDVAIRIDGVTKQFGHIVAVDDLSLTVRGVDPLMEREFRRCVMEACGSIADLRRLRRTVVEVSFRDSKPLLDNIPGISGVEVWTEIDSASACPDHRITTKRGQMIIDRVVGC